MADFTDKFSGKQYRISTFAQLSASVASNAVVDGRRHEFLPEKADGIKGSALAKLPYRIKQGDQAKFFPGLKEGTSHGKIETGSIIRDTERGIVYIPIKKKNFQDNIIGVGSHISTSFSTGAYEEISASFASKFSGINGETLMMYMVEEFYSSSDASKASAFVGQLIPSFNILESGSTSASFSAIHSGSLNRDFAFEFPDSNYITHWALRFDNTSKPSIFYSSSINFGTVFARFEGRKTDQNQTGSFNLTSNTFLSPGSGSVIGHGVGFNINGTDTSDGSITSYTFKSRVAGDADSGSLYNIATQFPGVGQIIMYRHHAVERVHSGSFSYNSSSRDAATGSTEYKTLYFFSGSGAGTLKNTDYGFFISGGIPTVSQLHGTPIHNDATLRHNADAGFYSPSGSQYSSSILVQTASGATSGKGPVFAQQLVL